MTLTQSLQKDYGTESTWLTMPENVVRVYRSLLLPNRMGELVLNNHFDGMQYAIKNAVMMVTMTERDDIDVTMSNNATIPDEFREEKVSLFIYDKYEGGLGYSEKIYDLICPAICVNIGTSGFNPGFVLYYLVVGFILFGVSGWMADKKLSV